MHCRRVRSYLSAFSNDELTGAVQREVREHLSACRDCRTEEAVYRSMRLAVRQGNAGHVSSKFNTVLMDRLAQERFAETRTKAYLPKHVPWFQWGRALVTAGSVLVLAVVAIGLTRSGGFIRSTGEIAVRPVEIGKDDSYKYAQPAQLKPEWSLNNHVEQSDRIAHLTNSMTQLSAFSQNELASQSGPAMYSRDGRMPYVLYLYRTQPVIKVYNQTGVNAAYREGDKVF